MGVAIDAISLYNNFHAPSFETLSHWEEWVWEYPLGKLFPCLRFTSTAERSECGNVCHWHHDLMKFAQQGCVLVAWGMCFICHMFWHPRRFMYPPQADHLLHQQSLVGGSPDYLWCTVGISQHWVIQACPLLLTDSHSANNQSRSITPSLEYSSSSPSAWDLSPEPWSCPTACYKVFKNLESW